MVPVVAVTGATGKQGGSVVKHLLKDGGYKVRALTRNPNSDRGKALQAQGVEVIEADFNNPAGLKAAFSGCTAAFLVTNWWEHHDTDLEIAQGKALSDACKAADVKHVVWSGLEDTRPALKGKAKPLDSAGRTVPHCDGKAEVAAYMMETGAPTTEFVTSFFLDNFFDVLRPYKSLEDVYNFTNNIPGNIKMSVLSIADMGGAVVAIIKQGPEKWGGKTVGWCTDQVTWEDITSTMTEVLGLSVRHMYLEDDQFLKALQAAMPQGAEEMVNMFMSFREGQEAATKLRDLGASRSLYPGSTMKDWMIQNKVALLKAISGA